MRRSKGRVKPRADTASVTTVENASSGYPDDDQQSAEMDIDGPDTPGKVSLFQLTGTGQILQKEK